MMLWNVLFISLLTKFQAVQTRHHHLPSSVLASFFSDFAVEFHMPICLFGSGGETETAQQVAIDLAASSQAADIFTGYHDGGAKDRGGPCVRAFLPDHAKNNPIHLEPAEVYLLPNLPAGLRPRLNHQVFIYTTEEDDTNKTTEEMELSEVYFLKGIPRTQA